MASGLTVFAAALCILCFLLLLHKKATSNHIVPSKILADVGSSCSLNHDVLVRAFNFFYFFSTRNTSKFHSSYVPTLRCIDMTDGSIAGLRSVCYWKPVAITSTVERPSRSSTAS